jgi:hypothetical protein
LLLLVPRGQADAGLARVVYGVFVRGGDSQWRGKMQWKYPNPSKHRIVLYKTRYFCHMLLYKFTYTMSNYRFASICTVFHYTLVGNFLV